MIDGWLMADLVAWCLQTACLVTLGALLPPVLRLDSASVRYGYFRGLLLLCFLLPVLQTRPVMLPAPVPDEPTAPAFSYATIGLSPAPAAIEPASFAWTDIVAVVFFAGVFLRLAWLTFGLWRLHVLKRRSIAFPPSAMELELQHVIRTRAVIRRSRGICQPVTFGVWRPVVLLPERFEDHPTHVRRAVLSHELFHVRNRDWAWLLLEEAVRSLCWFNPAVWWLTSRVQLAREEAIDEQALIVAGSRRDYIEALMAFADEQPLIPAAAFSRTRHLFRRVMLISREAHMSTRRMVLSCALAALVVAAGAWRTVAFPLSATVAVSEAPLSEPGPLERRAQVPDETNSLPRRIFAVNPSVPAEAAAIDVGAMLYFVITLDGSGGVGEVRLAGHVPADYGTPDASNRTRAQVDPAAMAAARKAIIGSATDALRRWRYEPPVKPPSAGMVAFTVATRVKQTSEEAVRPMSFQLPVFRASRSSLAGSPRGLSATTLPSPPLAQTRTPGQVVPAAPPPPPPPPQSQLLPASATNADPPEWPADALRVGGSVRAPKKVTNVAPVYPPIAVAAQVQGVVIVRLLIERDGHVAGARILKSVPLLDQAALDAVTQWEFEPTLLNGQPVPLTYNVTVAFTLAAVSPPPPPPPPPPPAQGFAPDNWPADAVRVGGDIRAPKKVIHVDPVYPPVAAAAQQQGVVIVQLLIERDGHVAGARIVRSVPLLDRAALDAVARWKFEPTLLNGQPVPVTYNVTVNFTPPRQ